MLYNWYNLHYYMKATVDFLLNENFHNNIV